MFTHSAIVLIIRLRKDTVGSTPTRPTKPSKECVDSARGELETLCAFFC